MLTIIIPGDEHFNDETNEFFTVDDISLELEHSLVSLSKWEQIYEKPFLSPEPKTPEELLDYIKCMCISKNTPGEIFHKLSQKNVNEIDTYINKKMTATWFSDQPHGPRNREIITSELIYFWMTSYQIPQECENWHLNRLFTLIRVANVKNSKPKRMSRSEMASRNARLNAERKAKLGTQG